MHEKENEVPNQVREDGVEDVGPGEETVEERQAEEFASEMNAEPHNIDGETGVATPLEEQAAASVEHTSESVDGDPVRELQDEQAAGVEHTSGATPQSIPPSEETVEERQAEEFASEMNAEPHNIDGETGVATSDEEQAAAAVEHTTETGEEPSDVASPDPATSNDSAGEAPAPPRESLSADEILAPDAGKESSKWLSEDAELSAMLEAVIYITDEPLTLEQIATALEQPRDRVKRLLAELVAEWQKPQHGLSIREVAGGYKMTTKPEHHDAVRQFVKNLKPPMKLSLPALETMAVIAYKQPVTAPEIMEIRGVQGAGVLKTLIDRKLIAPAGRKNVIGKPILYKTTREFLVQFGLKDLSELPSVKEFEELARFSIAEPEPTPEADQPARTESREMQSKEEVQPDPAAEPVVE